mmetsp:Transcript_51909/g.143792  ORF Transcript_51909/g.143792 Transcript_51909/m.143792 type:complete len:226 (+) Transcript_51909:1483-2160(+)
MWNLKPHSGMSGSIRKSEPPERRWRSMPNQRMSLARSYSAAVGSRIIPPSHVVRCLIAWSEKTQMLPWLPSFSCLCSAPIACAQSSMTCGRKPYFSKHTCWMRATRSRSMGMPPQWTSMIILVVGDSFASRSSRSIMHVVGSASTHLIRSRLARIGQLEAVQVSGHVSTSSTCSVRPGHAPSRLAITCSAKCRPDVAELRVSTRGLPKKRRSSSSKASTLGPCVT